MERPGFLEFVVYALVLAITAGWVYALPPFDHQPQAMRSADIQPAATTASDSPEGDPTGSSVTDDVGSADEAAPEPEAAAGPESRSEPQSQTGDDTAEEPQRDVLMVTARSLNMRSEPSAQSALVGSWPRGSLVEKVDTSGNWVLVRTEDDSTGWMYAGYLAEPGEN